MELIIEIPEEQYNNIVKYLTNNDGNYAYSDFNLREIIRNGTPYNPSGDCISREALKKSIEEVEDNYDGYEPNDLGKFMNKVYDLIDNAQTVEAYTLEDMQNNFDSGVDSVIGKYDKAKGEWIKWNFKTFGPMGDWEYKCSNCEKVYGGKYNYCPNCGADMRGGAE